MHTQSIVCDAVYGQCLEYLVCITLPLGIKKVHSLLQSPLRLLPCTKHRTNGVKYMLKLSLYVTTILLPLICPKIFFFSLLFLPTFFCRK